VNVNAITDASSPLLSASELPLEEVLERTAAIFSNHFAAAAPNQPD